MSVGTPPAVRAATPLAAGLGAGRDLRRRLVVHHLPLAVASTLAVLALAGASSHRGGLSVRGLAAPTGDVALALLATTLLVGPANLLLRRNNPPNSYLRRDLGIWTAIVSLVHVVAGLQGHGGAAVGGLVDYFVAGGRPRLDRFGLANWTGLAATVVALVLLAVSTDRSLRQLKARRWKALQRLNYALFAVVVVHAVLYGALQRSTTPTLVLITAVDAVLVGQAVGVGLRRRRNRAQPAA